MKKVRNQTKNVQRRRSSTRLADGATLYDHMDDSRVKRTTPLQTKMRQMTDASELGIDPQRERSRSRKRANKEVKPIFCSVNAPRKRPR